MKMKKSLLAVAVSGGLIAAPMAASASPEVYGLIDIGLEHYTDSENAAGLEIFQGFNSIDGNSDQKEFALQNGMSSRLGVRGEEKLDVGGLTASYNFELAIDVLGETGGGFADSVGTRLGWAAIGGDWGTVKVGTQWMPLFEYGGWNTMRTDTHGYGTYFYVTELLSNTLRFGFRQGSAISYSYGSAWGHSDSFAFNVTAGIGEGEVNGTQNEKGLSSIQVAGQYSFDKRISVNAVYLREFNEYEGGGVENFEPELVNVGGRVSVTDALEFGVNYMVLDTNNVDGDKRDAFTIGSFMDFGSGLTGHLGVGNGSDDRDEDVTTAGRDIETNVFGFVKQALSDRTNVRLELEHVRYEGAAVNDGKATVAMVALQHAF
ncbi:MAG: porin [Oleiphilaceae bacterium]|nr:porin [Oleiphilaceae bacterium]